MTEAQLLYRFNKSIAWNTIVYITVKAISTLTMFFLYYMLTISEFAALASLQSTVYLALLWVDGGLRKSIPRYLPFITSSKQNKHYVRYGVIYLLCLLAASFLLLYSSPSIASYVNAQEHTKTFWLIAPLFYAEGLVSLTRLLYHTFFLNKLFAILSTIVAIIEPLVFAAAWYTSCSFSLFTIIVLKISVSSLLTIASFLILLKKKIWRLSLNTTTNTPATIPSTVPFLKHSGYMWLTTALKSLSERNTMIPLIAHYSNPTTTVTYKVALDAALLIQRAFLRTISVNDTVLLSYGYNHPQRSTRVPYFFSYLTKRIAQCCVPVFFSAFVISLFFNAWFINHTSLLLFLIIIFSYLLEVILSPYERILEIFGEYSALFTTYLSYIFSFGIFLTIAHYGYFRIIPVIILIHLARLSSLCLMARRVELNPHLYYNCHFPWAYFLNLGGWYLTGSVGILLFISLHSTPSSRSAMKSARETVPIISPPPK